MGTIPHLRPTKLLGWLGIGRNYEHLVSFLAKAPDEALKPVLHARDVRKRARLHEDGYFSGSPWRTGLLGCPDCCLLRAQTTCCPHQGTHLTHGLRWAKPRPRPHGWVASKPSACPHLSRAPFVAKLAIKNATAEQVVTAELH
jgi:hypothetical protein